MEYCNFGSVEEYSFMKQQMKEDEMREIASCCLLGMNDLHSRNFAHGVIVYVRAK